MRAILNFVAAAALVIAATAALSPMHAQQSVPGVVSPNPGLRFPDRTPTPEIYQPPPIQRAPTAAPSFPSVPPPPPVQAVPTTPGAPPKIESYGDRATRCIQHGTSVGVPAGDIGRYSAECAQSR